METKREGEILHEVEVTTHHKRSVVGTFDDKTINGIFNPQSGFEAQATMSQVSQTQSENVQFSDQGDQHVYDMGGSMDATRSGQDSGDAELGNFFSRPIKVDSTEWGVNTTLFQSFNPWKLYFENPRVANRLANFNLLRCKLHVKMVINGNSFLYGRAIASYLPMHTYDTLSQNIALIPQTLVQASQQPHIYLDPTTSTGGELILPFFYYKNNMSIPDSDWDEMGELTIRSINTLKHANGAADQVTISTFVWAEDVTLGVLTSVESGALTPQSGKEVDEANAKGMISGPATSIACAASALSTIPVIGPYAKATESGANMLASMAKLLGYSRPPVTKNAEPYKPTATSSLAVTTVPDGTDKLTVDDKQELSVDPRIAGLDGDDPLLITSISQRESYLTSFDWNIGTAPETLLWNCRVSPALWAVDPTNGIHMPACCAAVYPFKYWTGTMKYRFQVVNSAFHKGRLKVVYDPNYLSSNEYNTNYLEIIDITDKNDFTISVKNGQEFTLLERADFQASVTTLYSTTAYTTVAPGNGVIGVYVVNELTTPNSTVTNDIQVNVYISTGDDFQVFVPDDQYAECVFKPQSGMEVEHDSDEKDMPEQTSETPMGNRYDSLDNIASVYVGESIKSFRPLLKRYNVHSAFSGDDLSESVAYLRDSSFPFLRGNVSGAVHLTSVDAPYNFCNTLLLHWVTLGFSGWRGSIRRKIIPHGNLITSDTSTMYANRTTTQLYDYERYTLLPCNNSSQTGATVIKYNGGVDNENRRTPHGALGSAMRIRSVNPVLEFESPFYSRDRFNPGKVANWTTSSSSRRNVEFYEIRWQYDGDTNTRAEIHVSAGEDFQVYFWTGMPPVYLEVVPPNPLL